MIAENNKKLLDFIEDLDQKLDKVVSHQEKTYLKGTLDFVQTKERELGEVIKNLRVKNDSITTKDEEIINLKKELIVVRQEIYNCENTKNKNDQLMKECREVYH